MHLVILCWFIDSFSIMFALLEVWIVTFFVITLWTQKFTLKSKKLLWLKPEQSSGIFSHLLIKMVCWCFSLLSNRVKCSGLRSNYWKKIPKQSEKSCWQLCFKFDMMLTIFQTICLSLITLQCRANPAFNSRGAFPWTEYLDWMWVWVFKTW